MIKQELEQVISGRNLSFEESHRLMSKIMVGEVNNSQISALLTALKIKGEVAEEVAGFALAMREKSITVEINARDVIDVCGTGGDSSGTFNISTTAAFIVAGCGVRVAKHGNRSISSSSGSADVLAESGIDINLSAEDSARALDEVGITFMFAPNHHPAMKYVAPVRKELAMKTVFNILGPLTNPAGTKKQMIGTFNEETAELMAKAAEKLDMAKVCFICTDNRYDEILLSGKTSVFEYTQGSGIHFKSLTNADFNLPEVNIEEIKGESPVENAEILRRILDGSEKGSPYYVSVANAAMGLYAADYSDKLQDCVAAAQESVDSGKALEKLRLLQRFS
jgi:anthranilate phosphoribosyltransferase